MLLLHSLTCLSSNHLTFDLGACLVIADVSDPFYGSLRVLSIQGCRDRAV